MYDVVEPGCSPRLGRQDAFNEALSEDTSPAQNCIAAETPRRNNKLHHPSSQRQIREASPISAMDSFRAYSHPGHRLMSLVARTVITVVSPSQMALSTSNPRGINADERRARCILLIPL
jgi:hypothetical protein